MDFNIITFTVNAEIIFAIVIACIIKIAIVIIALFFDSLRRIYVLYDEMKELKNGIKELDDIRRIAVDYAEEEEETGGDFQYKKAVK